MTNEQLLLRCNILLAQCAAFMDEVIDCHPEFKADLKYQEFQHNYPPIREELLEHWNKVYKIDTHKSQLSEGTLKGVKIDE